MGNFFHVIQRGIEFHYQERDNETTFIIYKQQTAKECVAPNATVLTWTNQTLSTNITRLHGTKTYANDHRQAQASKHMPEG
jgi:hypothetical protein